MPLFSRQAHFINGFLDRINVINMISVKPGVKNPGASSEELEHFKLSCPSNDV
jgi:hypothetical protein